MSLADYEKAANIMSGYPDLQDFVGPRPEHLIEAAETALGSRFPPTYHRFLREYGAGSFGSAEVFGIVDANFAHSSVPNGIWYTLSERKESGLPSGMVVIHNDGMGDLLCLDGQTTNNEGEAQVVRFQPGVPAGDQHREVVAPDFGRFLLDLVEQEIASSEG